MKTVDRSTEKNSLSFLKALIVVATLLSPAYMQAQNIVTNGDFNGGASTGWTTSCTIEINPENVYGGASNGNYVTEMDIERCIEQTICIFPGVTYIFSFKGSRRIGGMTPALVGISFRVRGVTSGSNYVNQTRYYNNTSFNLATSSYSFSVPANSTDRQVRLTFQSLNNNTTYGVLIDDITIRPQVEWSINGTNSAVLNSNYNFFVNNAPASGVSYSWNFASGSSPATSTSSSPTTHWTTIGGKNVTVAMSNGTCTVVTLSKIVAVSGVLPVTFTSFTGALKDDKAALRFSTSNEENNDYFVVEQSKDGRKYDSIGRIQANNTTGVHTYSFAASNSSSLSYYRIRQVDFNGGYTFSSIVMLKNTVIAKELSLFPSQAVSSIRYSVTLDQPSMAIVQVYDVTGKQVINRREALTMGANEQVLDISTLNAGSYFFKLQNMVTGVTAVKQFQKLN